MSVIVGNSYRLERTSDNEQFDANVLREDAHSFIMVNLTTEEKFSVLKSNFDSEYTVVNDLPGVKHSEQAPNM